MQKNSTQKASTPASRQWRYHPTTATERGAHEREIFSTTFCRIKSSAGPSPGHTHPGALPTGRPGQAHRRPAKVNSFCQDNARHFLSRHNMGNRGNGRCTGREDATSQAPKRGTPSQAGIAASQASLTSAWSVRESISTVGLICKDLVISNPLNQRKSTRYSLCSCLRPVLLVCGVGGVLNQLGPDVLPVVRAQIAAGHRAVSRPLNGYTALYGHLLLTSAPFRDRWLCNTDLYSKGSATAPRTLFKIFR